LLKSVTAQRRRLISSLKVSFQCTNASTSRHISPERQDPHLSAGGAQQAVEKGGLHGDVEGRGRSWSLSGDLDCEGQLVVLL